MRRHLDDHPSLNSNSGGFNSNSLPLSAANSTNSTSRIYSDLDARTGASNSNIPLTTTVTTTTPATLNSTFHSNRTLNAPISPGSGSNINKPVIPRQPLALIQETVHAVGTGGNSEMQSGVQFSLPAGFHQASVAAATTLSQGGLGHSQRSSGVHHPLPGQTQAHSNTQVVHPLPNSQAHVAGTQMQGHQFQKLKVEDALSYLDQVKYKFGNQPQVYNDFLDIMKEFKSQSIDTPGVIQRVSNLFRGHPELIVGFNTFLPLGYRIEVQPNEQVQVSIPGTNLGGGAGSTGPTSLTIHPGGPPSTSPLHSSQSNHSSHTTSPHSSPGNAINKSSNHTPPVANSQPHTNSQNQHVYNQNSPAHTQSGGGSPGVHSPSSTPQQASQPVEFNHAINYVNKIKNRFQGQPDIYKQFLEILHTYQKEQRNLKDGVNSVAKPLTEAEVYSQVAKLFQNQEDLLQEFGQFLPDANGAANALVGLQPQKAVNNEHTSVKKPSAPVKPITTANNQSKQIQSIKRPAPTVLSPPMKKPKMTSLKDVTLSEATKSGSLSEFAFFDKVRAALKSKDVYENFLRCLVIYNQELISRADLVLLVSPFLSKYADLFKWFKDFLGYKENVNNVEIVPKKMETQEKEKVIGDFATEIDYSSCMKYGASYRAVPRNYVQPKCSGRTALCREVLNDTWVSFPSWSEDSTFVSSRKTQFEEYIYRCEDERFELDVVLETNLSTIRILEAEITKMNRMSSDEKARYRLDDTLGGSSSVIQQRAIKRIYGDKAGDIIEGLKKNPATAVPLVLRRLKTKEEEWRKAQKNYNKLWREQNEKYYLKSLDHQGINFKQNDVKFLRSKSILNEIETLYEERHEQAEDGMSDVPAGPHVTLYYKSKDTFKDAANLIIHHVKRQTGIHKEDKQKIKQLMRQFFPDFFSVPRGDPSDDEMDKDEDMETEDGNESPKSSVFRDLLSLKNAGCGVNNVHSWETSANDRNSPSQDEKNSDKSFYGSVQNTMDNSLPDESYTLMFVNNNWYIFFRLYHILCERLWKIQERAQFLIAEEMKDREERKQSTALALRLKPRNNIDIQSYYPAFLDMVKNLLDGNIESSQYEDNLREMFGIHAYMAFTLDKVIQNAVRQLQHIVGDESCTQWTSLFLEEKKNTATGGPCATTSQRAAAELAYLKRAEQICDENLFKLIIYKEEGKLTIELLDSDSDAAEDQRSTHKWNAFIKKFTCEESIANILKDKLADNPVFLPRLINSYKKRAQNSREMEYSESAHENEIALRNIQDEIDDSKIDLSRLEDGGAGEAVKGLVGLNAKAKYLERTRQNKIAENGESPNGGCRFDMNSYKMTWIMDSEQTLYRKKCLTKASQSHQKVSQLLRKKFHIFHKQWLKDNVDDEQEKSCRNWLLGLTEDTLPTNCIRVDNPSKPPYSPYNRYKVQVREKT